MLLFGAAIFLVFITSCKHETAPPPGPSGVVVAPVTQRDVPIYKEWVGSADGSTNTGPSWKGLYGAKVELEDGATVTADESYLRESITDPNAKIVKGYQPLMPVFKGLVTQKQLDALVAYIKSVK